MAKKPVEASQAGKLDALGIDAICARIECGESQAEIARSLELSAATLSTWLNQPERAERSARAREMSAEAWLDRGLEAIESALSKTGTVDASAAKAFAQECARRAALRNPRYVDKTAHEHSGPGGGPLRHAHELTDDQLAAIATGIARAQ
jgi:hypothetical protein